MTTLQITGPLDGATPSMGGAADYSSRGYLEEEFLISGVATSYDGAITEDGAWDATPGATAPFTTRFVVRRPVDASRFNGTVVVEWNNVSGGGDGSPDWMFLQRHIVRTGMVWVGVSAQKVGIDGGGFVQGANLKVLDPERYGGLEHPGDAFAYDMFTQVGRAIRDASDPPVLGGLRPERLVAAGESQSAGFLATYINGVDPLVQVYDGYFVHGRAASGAALDGFRMVPPADDDDGAVDLASVRRLLRQQSPQRIRADVRVPVITIQSETDTNNMGVTTARQPDDDRVRLWEIAGAAHGDAYFFMSQFDDGTLTPERMLELLAPTNELLGGATDTFINNGPQQHYVAQAALAHLEAWVRDGTPPPSAPRLALLDDGDFERDELGIADGGIRTPWVDAPTSRLSGIGGDGGGFAFLFGVTEPFDGDQLAKVYPGDATSTSRAPAPASPPRWPTASSSRTTRTRSTRSSRLRSQPERRAVRHVQEATNGAASLLVRDHGPRELRHRRHDGVR